ncbi:MAG: saccharopine dehydrogenase NADP-binding domain-containing protein, partial [Actinomycetota bacterium]
MSAQAHPNRVLVLGCGSVAQCVIPLLLRDLKIKPSSLSIIDFVDNRPRVADAIKQGAIYEIGQVTRENLDAMLSPRLSAGDILLDLAWNIDCTTILEWCRNRGVRYLNTSVELWDPYYDMAATNPRDRTLYVRHQSIRKMIGRWGANNGPSSVVEHGANPGLVSHFAKQALFEISNKILSEGRAGSR